MEPMFLHYGQSALTSLYDTGTKIVSRVLRFFGIGESALETEIEDLIDAQSNPTIAPLAADGEVTLRLTASHSNLETAQTMLDKTEKEIRSRVGQYLYGYDNSSLMKELVALLFEKKLTIAVAESLTGGLFQQELTAIPGTSALLKGGVVCYTNFVKQKVLNVKADTIEKYGAVSEQCASELAKNVAALLGTDIGISFTGVAGPDELEGKQAGTVYVGISIGKKTFVEKLLLGGTRDAIRTRSVKCGCFYLMKLLHEMD
jgi:nicotinamide-nucleotide amidase